jgi:hypothetical protein
MITTSEGRRFEEAVEEMKEMVQKLVEEEESLKEKLHHCQTKRQTFLNIVASLTSQLAILHELVKGWEKGGEATAKRKREEGEVDEEEVEEYQKGKTSKLKEG